MCGITGIISKDAKKYESNLKSMTSCIKYRGPDETGSHLFDTCALGHARLSIVDLGNGQQPMLTPDARVGLVFNGEIYGYKDIKKGLSDYHFRTASDTEVILALYGKYKKEMLRELPGMFAFGLWDDESKELFAARDRFGEKPFYYAHGKNGEFIFASEIKAILASGLVEPILNLDSVTHYLRHLYVNPYTTIYSNIHVLPPAHALSLKDGKLTTWRYWQPPATDQNIGLDEAVTKFKELFEKAVQSQLVADVPVGAFLSGGLDSSTVVAVASHYQQKLKTFAFRFKDGGNELQYAKEIADKYETDHTELFDSNYDIADLLLKMDDIYDEPFADSSNIATYIISKLAREHVTVVITGDGGDELLGGYTAWYKPFLYARDNTMDIPSWTEAMAPYLMKALHRARAPYRNEIGNVLAGAKLKKRFDSVFEAHSAQNTYFSDKELHSLFRKDKSGIAPPPAEAPYQPYWKSTNTLDDVLRMDIDDYMPGDILMKIDRAAMANSLELRAPFLDPDFASFCISLPYRLKIDKESDKIILRKAFFSYLPESLHKRPKMGFGAPVHKWLKLPKVKQLKQEYLADPKRKIFEVLDFDAVQAKAKADTYQTWILLILSIWLENRPHLLEHI